MRDAYLFPVCVMLTSFLSLQIESVNDKAGIVYSGMGPDYRCVCVCGCGVTASVHTFLSMYLRSSTHTHLLCMCVTV